MTAGTPIKTTCPYCGVGCGVIATPQQDGSLAIAGDQDHPANFGRLCSKGSALGETVDLDGRLLEPKIGDVHASWDEALDLTASKFKEAIDLHGPDSVAFYVSGQLLTEDYYVANKLMKGYIGSANIDTNSRLCMASSVVGHKRAFGSDTVPCSYEDLEDADLLVLVGSNLAWCHPVLYQRIVAAKEKRPHMKVVLIDPRRTATADLADFHLPIAPDGDVALFLGLLKYLAAHDRLNHSYIDQHTEGFSNALQSADDLDMEAIQSLTAIAPNLLNEFFALWSKTEKVVTLYSQGVNQSTSGTDKVNAIINCHLATGRIGRDGMGPFSITGQPNAMGGREVGGLATMLAAHMDIANPDHQSRVKRFWQSPHIAQSQGLKAVDLFDAVACGQIKALWIMATNPVDSMPNARAVEAAIKACPFVVVSDIMADTDTMRHADVALPSLGWGEKSGTVTNSERRISRQRGFLPAPGQAKADWWQLAEVAQRMGFEEGFNYPDAASIYREYAALTCFENSGTRDLDLSGHDVLLDEEYDALQPVQWPLNRDNRRQFFADGSFFTPSGKAQFITIKAQSLEVVTQGLKLNTGRIRDHWHTMTRTAKSARLSAHIAEPFVEINPKDAHAIGVIDADLARVKTPFGAVIMRVLITDRVKQGEIFAPMHWTDQFASQARIDCLIAPETDPFSGQPALKSGDATVQKAQFACYGFMVSTHEPNIDALAYWAKAKAKEGWRMEFASTSKVDDIQNLATILGHKEPLQFSTIHDPQLGVARLVATSAKGAFRGAIFIAPQPVQLSRSWMVDQLALSVAMGETFNPITLLAARPSHDMPDKGAIVCSCMGVGVNQIESAIAKGCNSIEAIGKATRAGTNCGSCKSEIRAMFDDQNLIAAE